MHPPVLFHILERHRRDVAAAFVFPQLPADTLARAVRGAIALDGWYAIPRLAAHAAKHWTAGATNSPPHFLSVAAVFKRFELPVFRFQNPNHAGCVAELRRLQPDVLFNTQPWKIKPDVLAVPRLVSVNQHCGDLAKYRGVEPVVRAMLGGERAVQMTLHTMTADYDAGAVLASATVPIRRSVFETYAAAFREVPALFDRMIQTVSAGAVPAPAAPGPYFGPLTANERQQFRASGLRYL